MIAYLVKFVVDCENPAMARRNVATSENANYKFAVIERVAFELCCHFCILLSATIALQPVV